MSRREARHAKKRVSRSELSVDDRLRETSVVFPRSKRSRPRLPGFAKYWCMCMVEANSYGNTFHRSPRFFFLLLFLKKKLAKTIIFRMLNAERFKREPISCTIGPLFVLRRPLVLSLHWSVFLIYSAPMCALSVIALAITSMFPTVAMW
jgi:hypothetical protein